METKIQCLLTSRIETRSKDRETYYYGFFKLENQELDVPVIFKTKPDLVKGSQSQINWNLSQFSKKRPSFTCSFLLYKFLKLESIKITSKQPTKRANRYRVNYLDKQLNKGFFS